MKFGIGDIVQFYNHEHVWHGQIAIVRGIRPAVDFYRIELLGKLTWVPGHWLLPAESENEQIEHQ